MTLQKLKDEARKEFEKKIGIKSIKNYTDLGIATKKLLKENDKIMLKFIDSLIDKAYEESRRDFIEAEIERKKGMRKTIPKSPLDMTLREQMNQTIQPVYRPYVSNEESCNQDIDEDIAHLQSLISEK